MQYNILVYIKEKLYLCQFKTTLPNEVIAMINSYKEHAYSYIRNKILSGGLPAGTRLSDIALAREIGISRTPIREALNQLLSEHLAEQVPHYGIFVPKMNRNELEELYDLRELLESYAVSKAAKNRTAQQMAEMIELYAQMKEFIHEFYKSGKSDFEGTLAARHVMLDVKLHTLILNAANVQKTQKIVGDLCLLTSICGRRRFIPGYNIPQMLLRTYRQHGAIIRSIYQQKEESARLWMSLHILHAKEQGLMFFDYQDAAETHDKEATDYSACAQEAVPNEGHQAISKIIRTQNT